MRRSKGPKEAAEASDPALAEPVHALRMYVTPRLWVGEPPRDELSLMAATAEEAAASVERGYVATVPDIETAVETLLLLGATREWAEYLTAPKGLIDVDEIRLYEGLRLVTGDLTDCLW